MRHAVRNLLRLIAIALAVFGVIELYLEFLNHRLHQEPVGWGRLAIGLVLVVAGIALLAGSARLAKKLTEDFDE